MRWLKDAMALKGAMAEGCNGLKDGMGWLGGCDGFVAPWLRSGCDSSMALWLRSDGSCCDGSCCDSVLLKGMLLKGMVCFKSVCFKKRSFGAIFSGKVCSVECAAYFDRWDLYLFVC